MKKIFIGLTLLLATTSIAVAANEPATTTITTTTFTKVKAPKSLLAADNIVVKTPVIELVQNDDNSAEVFMELDNKGNKTITLIAANSMTASQTMLHKSVERNGEETMRKVSKIVIRPHNDTDLQQGGLHVMLMELKQSLHKGDSVPILLIFDDGSSMTVHAVVS